MVSRITNHDKNICPVCGMEADHDVHSVERHNMFFHFCSVQCRETFSSHPQLYTKAPKTVHEERLKQRTMRLAEPLVTEVTERLIPYLLEMMGVKKVKVEGAKVHITYDLLQVTEIQIEKELVEIGLQLGDGWLEHLRRGWVEYSEEAELGNLAASPAPCCNRPPPKPE